MFLRIVIALVAAAACGLPAAGAFSAASTDAEGAETARAGSRAGVLCTKRAMRRSARTRRVCRRSSGDQEPSRATESEGPLFAPSSFWNARLADDAPLDSKSSAYVNRLQYLLTRWVPYVNTTRHSVPVYTVAADQRKVRVKLDNTHRDLQAAFERVPLPGDARPAAGSDAHLVVWQPSTDTMWEFWRAEKRWDGWHARYGGRMTDVSTNPGHFTENPKWGATATSLPLLGGLMRIDELKAGRVDHALAIALPEIRANAWSWPAQRSDGKSSHFNAIPEGVRFRLDPRLDLSTIPMAPIVRTMAVAAQRYGIVVRDGAGAVTFYAEDPTPTGHNPFLGENGLFGGGYISETMREFPWKHLKVLKTKMTYEDGPLLLPD